MTKKNPKGAGRKPLTMDKRGDKRNYYFSAMMLKFYEWLKTQKIKPSHAIELALLDSDLFGEFERETQLVRSEVEKHRAKLADKTKL